MSLTGDAMAHAILPGAAVGFLVAGLEILPMTLGGLIAGLIVALAAGAVSRLTVQREDASLAAFYLISLALGVLLVSIRGSSVDLMHVLFGTVLALNDQALYLIAGIAAVTLAAWSWCGGRWSRNASIPCSSGASAAPARSCITCSWCWWCSTWWAASRPSARCSAVGIMMLPAAAARFWVNRVLPMCALAVAFGVLSGVVGLLLSYHLDAASGPAIILTAGTIYLVSAMFGRRGIIGARLMSYRHRTA